ncbi:hypothetical protein [Aestuariibaculum suncheonense]|uniref:Uncharacterized protein n=1 Tax=Aestuariibaculum suncheonense TaxID=1028745 RepID=A0A8J6QHT4_9FLAO|nr:hypothetical protein [Aestuariibaculum suncheonense]MBD0836688.1 hypothetical protein [Aestuariibaculum suncheonense]
MSKELQNPQQSSEEVDLGQLFKLIGNAFDRFFKFIASIFKGLFSVVLMLLIHFYKRFLWYVGAVVLGVVVGFIIDKNSDKLYGANLFIETNFNSARQVYENIRQLHELASKDQDSVELGSRLGITSQEAAKIKGFYIEPDIDENKVVEMYSEFYMHLDSLSRTEMTYEQYKSSLTAYNFKIHQIGVASTNKGLYQKIEKHFVKELSNNAYLEELSEVNTQNLKRKDQTLSTQLKKNDSLVDVYLKIRLKKSDKEPVQGSGTNLYMGNAESNGLIVDESKLIDKRLELEAQRRAVYEDLVEQKNVINVLSGFPKTGYDIRAWTDKMKFLLPLIFLGVTLLSFIILGLGQYLKEQTK